MGREALLQLRWAGRASAVTVTTSELRPREEDGAAM